MIIRFIHTVADLQSATSFSGSGYGLAKSINSLTNIQKYNYMSENL